MGDTLRGWGLCIVIMNPINFLEKIDLILPNLHDFQFSVYVKFVDVISLGTLNDYNLNESKAKLNNFVMATDSIF